MEFLQGESGKCSFQAALGMGTQVHQIIDICFIKIG